MRNFLSLDRTVLITLLTRLCSILGGIGSVFLVTKYFSLELQGYYYAFGSLIALQIFVELGLTYAITQFISHEMAGLNWSENKTLQGSSLAKTRLKSITLYSFFWFSLASIIMLVVLIPVGIFFFSINSPLTSSIHPEIPWSLVVILTIFILLINAALAIIEGCNEIEDVAKIRFFQTFFSILGLWIGLSNNFQLYSIVISTFISVFVGVFLIIFKYKNFFLDLHNFKVHLIHTIWKNEIWPFQWKIAISWISGYFIYQSFVPLLFAIHGPAQAGQMGMTLQIILTLSSTALVWITTKAPFFGKLIAEKNFKKLDKIFFNALIKSYFFMIFSSFFLIGALYYLGEYYPDYSNRLIPLNYFIILLFGAAFNHFTNSSAFYLRAFKEERFMYLSVFMSSCISGLAFILIPLWGEFGAVVSYSAGVIFIGFPWALTIFLKNKRRVI